MNISKRPYIVEDTYRRFNQKYTMGMRILWEPRWGQGQDWGAMSEAVYHRIAQNEKDYTLWDYAACAGAQTLSGALGTCMKEANAGLLSWDELKVFGSVLSGFKYKLEVADPAEMSQKIKSLARYFGAEMVGIANLDDRWVYSEHYFPSTGNSKPVEIPKECQFGIVMGIGMDYNMIGTSPTVVHMTETEFAYSKMALIVSSLAQSIRALGYKAIPCLNDTALSIPMAIDAGFGQAGRHDMLITPQFGPRVRLCKVITELPLKADKPIDFGVTESCNNCTLCASGCPAGAIPFGERTTQALTISNNPGVLKWNVNPEKCFSFWVKNGAFCSDCIKVCPYNKERRKVTRKPSLA